MKIKIKHNNTWKSGVWYAKHQGEWKAAEQVFIKKEGIWYPLPPEEMGNLTVTINPSEARSAGAQWKISDLNTGWMNSGDTLTDILIGTYKIEYKVIEGWEDPGYENIIIEDGITTETTKTYTEIITAKTGNLKVYINPHEARAQRIWSPAPPGRWRRQGTGSWKYHGDTEQNIPIGTYTVEFNDVVENYSKPWNRSVTIREGQTTEITGTYTTTSSQWPDLSWLNNKGLMMIQEGGATNHFLWVGDIRNLNNNTGKFEIYADKYGKAFDCDYTEATESNGNYSNIKGTHNPSGVQAIFNILDNDGNITMNSNNIQWEGISGKLDMFVGEKISSHYFSNKLVEVYWMADNDQQSYINCDTVSTIEWDGGYYSVMYYNNVPLFLLGEEEENGVHRASTFTVDGGFVTGETDNEHFRKWYQHNSTIWTQRVWRSTYLTSYWSGLKSIYFYFSQNKSRENWFSSGTFYMMDKDENISELPCNVTLDGENVNVRVGSGSDTLYFTGSYGIGDQNITVRWNDDSNYWIKWDVMRISNTLGHNNISSNFNELGIITTSIIFN